MGMKVAVVGATGAVGREMLKTLAERGFPVDEVVALASGRSAGHEVSFGEKTVLKVQNLETLRLQGHGHRRCSRPARRCRPCMRRAPRRRAAW